MKRFLSLCLLVCAVALAGCSSPQITLRNPIMVDSEPTTVAAPRLTPVTTYYAPTLAPAPQYAAPAGAGVCAPAAGVCR